MRILNSFFLIISLFTSSILAHKVHNHSTARDFIFNKSELDYIKKKKTISAIALSNFKPFSYLENGELKGLSIDILKKISDISGLKLNIKSNIWENNLQDFKNNKYDLIVDISYEKNREEFIYFSDLYYETPLYVFGNKNELRFNSFYDLENKKVAVLRNIYYKNLLLEQDINILETKSDKESALIVSKGKANFFLSTYINGLDAIKTQNIKNVHILGELKEFKKEELRFGINKKHRILKSIINKSLIHMSKKEYDELIKKWIEKDSKAKFIYLTNKEKKYLEKIKNLEICINKNHFPFERIYNNTYEGLTKDFIFKIQKAINKPIKLIEVNSFKEAKKSLENKACKMISLASKEINEDKRLIFSEPYFDTSLVLTTQFNVPFINNLSLLRNKTIALISNNGLKSYLENKYPSLNFVEVTNLKQGLEKVLKNKVFGLIDTLPVIIPKLQNEYLGELKIGSKLEKDTSFSIATSRENTLLISIINTIFNSITSIEKDKIINKNILIETNNSFNRPLFWKLLSVIFFIFTFLLYRQYTQNKNNKKLQESFTKIQSILDTTMEAIIISENSKIIDVNKEFLRLFNYKTKEEIIGKNIFQYIDKNSKDKFIKNYTSNFEEPYEIKLIKNHNEKINVLARGKNIKIAGSRFRVSSVLDLTDIKEKESLLIQQSKIATAGEMLENISHQWRQPLSQISTISTGIKLQKEFNILKDEDLVEGMENINKTVQYLSQTIEDFKDFLKPTNNQEKTFNIKNTLEKLVNLTKDAYKYHHIEVFYSKKDFFLAQNENLLIQALLNITNNAKDALSEKKDKTNSYIFIDTISKKNQLIIKIKDNAGGINKKIINKIFEPYFTTKHQALGTGIGLYMTFQIITKQMKGVIRVKNVSYSYEGIDYKGAEFTIFLPIE